MKLATKSVSIILVLTLLLGCMGLNAGASELLLPDYTVSEAQWNEYWETVKGDNTQVSLTPGADASRLGFNWHSQRQLAVPAVRISKSADMAAYTEFKGYSTLADNGQQTNRVTVDGLEENTLYYYTVSVDGKSWSEPEFYRTGDSSDFKALLVGDIQCAAGDDGYGYDNASTWNTLLNSALKNNKDADFIISCGDQTQSGESANEWAATLSPKALRNVPLATCIGNHDKKGTTYKHYVNNPNSYHSVIPNFCGNQYYFRYGDVLFVSLNTTSINVFSAYNVVEKAVSENPDAKWRVAFFHHDIYGTGHHAIDDDNYLLQGVFSAILDKFSFDIAFTGHEHFYGRSYNMLNNEIVPLDYSASSVTDPDGTLYITTASASGKNRVYDEPYAHPWLKFSYMSSELVYSTVEFTDTEFALKTYCVDGNKLIDEYSITKTDSTYPQVDTSENLLTDTDALARVLSHFMGDYYVIVDVLFNSVKVLFEAIKSVIVG